MIEKVKDPLKQVTDPVLLNTLAKQGIDKDYVEFWQDYAPRSGGKEHSPYAKFYRDLKSNKRFMVVSGLPMVDADGIKIEVGWRIAGINSFAEKNNLFQAKVQGTQVEITIRNDQPDGRKAGNKLTFKPQLSLNGVPIITDAPALLPIDPVNSNYLENTLEWDYGICKRRLRIIEGRLLGSWIFASKPAGEVRIKYNQIGDYRLRLGQFKVSDDAEVVKSEDFDMLSELQGYPVVVSDIATFYPDAHVESTSVDGYVGEVLTNGTWANLVAAAGDHFDDSGVTLISTYIKGYTSTNTWETLRRGIALFDTSGLSDDAIISAATLSLYGAYKQDGLSCAPNLNVYSSAPASNVVLAAGDFDSLGTTPFSTAITYANWKDADPFWNDFALNAAGIAAISKTGISKFGLRNANYDVAVSAPNWVNAAFSTLYSKSADQGAGYKPKLVVTYTSGGWANIAKVSGVTASSIAKVNGVAVASISKLSGVAV